MLPKGIYPRNIYGELVALKRGGKYFFVLLRSMERGIAGSLPSATRRRRFLG